MALPDKLYYSISELSDHFKVAPSLLRYWESEFSTIKPKRNSKGTRFYTKKDIAQIETIHHLVKEKGYTLQGAKEQIKQNRKKVDEKMEVLNKLEDIKEMLERLRAEM